MPFTGSSFRVKEKNTCSNTDKLLRSNVTVVSDKLSYTATSGTTRLQLPVLHAKRQIMVAVQRMIFVRQSKFVSKTVKRKVFTSQM